MTSTRQGDGTTQTFWDVATGADDGTIHFLLGHDGALEIDDGTWMKVAGVGGEYGGPLPFRMAATAQQWFDRLCTFSNRPFTDVERAALPAGSVIPADTELGRALSVPWSTMGSWTRGQARA